MKNLLLICGSPNSVSGQSFTIAKMIKHPNRILDLKNNMDKASWLEHIKWADGFIFLTGTYWDSWGSPLQNFLEQMTETEVSDLWLGKPAGVIVTMHSVGGKGVLSRLQGVLNTFGLVLPPLSGMVYSLSTHLLKKMDHEHAEDFWSLEEIHLITQNVMSYAEANPAIDWKKWVVDRADVTRLWIKD